ncbi:MAG: hypothetical protein FD167_3472 [bacterium]|nr:MAG: hypothetical protein FD167_3472 [bacterium]
MKIIIRTHPKREQYLEYLTKNLPKETIFSDDTSEKGARANFINALTLAENDSCLHLEDDILLTTDFLVKINKIVNKYSNFVIQFFSQSNADLVTGSRFDLGKNFLGCLCFYMPPRYSNMLLDYYAGWKDKNKHIAGYDLWLADWLRSRNEIYYISVPSLVQHRIGESLIYKNKSQERQSKTFIDPIPN